MKDVAGKTAFITGGVSGVGLGIAKVFAGVGMKTVITYRRQDHLDQAMGWFKARPHLIVHAIRVDVTDRQGLVRAADEAERVFGKVHVLCNNAGVNVFGPLDAATYEDWEWVMGVNFWGVVNGINTFVPRIKAHGEGGHIINVASMASFITGPQAGLYTTLRGMLRNDLYIFSHPEGRADVQENCEAILAAFPDEPVPAQRMAVEEMRRAAKASSQTKRTAVGDLVVKP